MRRTSEADEKRVLELKQQGRAQREIAEQMKMPRATVAVILKRAPEYESPRGAGGRISAYKAAKQHGLKPATLNDAIDTGLAPGEAKLNGRYVSRTVDPVVFDAWVASRRGRTCSYPACDAEALVFSVRCMKHTGGVTLPGHGPRDSEERIRMTAGKVGIERPDVAERYRHDWKKKGPLVTGLFFEEDGTPKPYFKGETRRDWKRRWRAPEVAKLPRQRGYSNAQLELARQLKKRDPNLGRDRLARLLNVTPKQARAILAELKG